MFIFLDDDFDFTDFASRFSEACNNGANNTFCLIKTNNIILYERHRLNLLTIELKNMQEEHCRLLFYITTVTIYNKYVYH